MTDGDPVSVGVTEVYARRFGPRQESRRLLWETLCDAWFQRYVRPTDTVVDIAAGYCEFINAIRAERRIAVDLNPAVADFVGPGVTAVVARSTALPADLEGTADVVFASNFFEHLADADELLATLSSIARLLKPTGRLLVLQPNIRLTGPAYWDFVDHSLPITERRLAEALELSGFVVEEQRTRFLPYTTESRLPISPALIRLYLRLPPAQFLLGKQTFVVARLASP